MSTETNRLTESVSRNLVPGDVLVHLPTASIHTVDRRKRDDSGWWLTDTGGVADRVFDGSEWRTLHEVISGYLAR